MAHHHHHDDDNREGQARPRPQHADLFGIRALDIDGREPCLVQGAKMGATSFLVGSLYGGVVVYWRDVASAEAIQRRGRLRALRSTLSAVGGYGGVFALVGATYGAVACALRATRDDPHDPLNPLLASCAAGAVLGARVNGTAFGSFMGCAVTAGLSALGQVFDWSLSPPVTSHLRALRQEQAAALYSSSSSSSGSDDEATH